MKMEDVHQTPDRIAFMHFLHERDESIYSVCKGAQISRSTLSHWLTGKGKSLRGETSQKILEYLNASHAEVFTDMPLGRKIPLVGKVAAGEHVVMLDASDVSYVETPPGLSPDKGYECLEVDGYSMPPALPGWRIYYSVEPVDVESVLNKPCVVRLTDGRLLFKVVRRFGNERRLFSLHSWSPTVPPIEPVEIAEARPFAALTPSG